MTSQQYECTRPKGEDGQQCWFIHVDGGRQTSSFFLSTSKKRILNSYCHRSPRVMRVFRCGSAVIVNGAEHQSPTLWLGFINWMATAWYQVKFRTIFIIYLFTFLFKLCHKYHVIQQLNTISPPASTPKCHLIYAWLTKRGRQSEIWMVCSLDTHPKPK